VANSLTNVLPQLLAQGLVALRQNAIMPRLVNTGYSPTAGSKGSTVDIPVSSAITANTVAPATTGQAVSDVSPTNKQIVLDQWKEAAFTLSDKEREEAMSGTIPLQATEAIKALANAVDQYILGKYTGIYAFGGVGGTTPFSSNLSEYVNARKELNRNLSDPDPRYCVIDEDADANALQLSNLLQADQRGDQETIVNGRIGRILAAQWFLDQNVPTHTAGTLSDGSGKTALVNVALAAGVTTMNLDNSSLTGTIVEGDVFSFAGHSGTYVATTAVITAAGNDADAVTFTPALRAAAADNEVVTFQDTHVVNLLFHRDCFALATRPLMDNDASELGSLIMSDVDETSGLTLRLEISRQHKQTRFAYDILYGAALVRPEFGARILG
jgi:hypothetical protein